MPGEVEGPQSWRSQAQVDINQPYYQSLNIYIGLSWLLELRQQLRTRGVGGGVGWDVNVHVNGTSFTNLIQVCAVPEAGTRMMMMMMLMMLMMM